MAKGKSQFEKWAEEFKSKLPENIRNSWTAVVDNDYEGKDELINSFLMQGDYTRKTQELADARKDLEGRLEAERKAAAAEAKAQRDAEYQSWYNDANGKYTTMQAKLEGMEKALQAAGYRAGDAEVKPETPPQNDSLLKEMEALKQRIAAVDRGTYNSVISLSTLAHRAAKENLPFAPDEIVKIATTKNVPITQAFDEFVKPEVEKRQKEALEKQLEEAREAGRREALSNRSTPDAMGTPSATSAVLDKLFNDGQKAQKVRDSDLLNEAIKGFYEAGQS